MTNFMGFSEFFMQNPILVLTLLAHVLADFQLQSQKMADLKSQRLNFLILHLGIVLLPLLLLGLVLPRYLLYFALVWLSHALIDFLKYRLNSLIVRHHAQKLAFILDQILHLISIFALYKERTLMYKGYFESRSLLLTQYYHFFHLRGLSPMTNTKP